MTFKSIFRTHSMILSVMLAAPMNAKAASSKCTSQSTSPECQAVQFESVYTDPSNNLSWSKTLPGTYTNGCVDANGIFDSRKCTFKTTLFRSLNIVDGLRQVKISDSLAAQACDKIGGRLPTKSEIESLIRSFDSDERKYGPRLTEAGRADMQAKFGDDMNNRFWSSSVFPDYPDVAFIFNGVKGFVDIDARDTSEAVRCVSGR